MPWYLRYPLFIVLGVVNLMSGLFSIGRELLLMYQPVPVQPKSAFWSFTLIAFVVSGVALLLIEGFKIRKLSKELESEKDRSRPNLAVPSGFTVITAPVGENDRDCMVMISTVIVNTGAPSIVTDIDIFIKMDDRELKGEAFPLAPGPVTMSGQLTLQAKQEDYLPRKAIEHIIANGGGIQGFHIVVVRNATQDEICKAGTIVILRFKDVVGKLYSFQQIIPERDVNIIDVTQLQRR
jgi:hypothetical protein